MLMKNWGFAMAGISHWRDGSHPEKFAYRNHVDGEKLQISCFLRPGIHL